MIIPTFFSLGNHIPSLTNPSLLMVKDDHLSIGKSVSSSISYILSKDVIIILAKVRKNDQVIDVSFQVKTHPDVFVNYFY